MNSKAITLDQLIPCPSSLRLLVLHTPSPMSLRPLIGCINLIKLDLSNNAIGLVPFLGHLTHLKFLFLHNNRIEFETFQQVFFEGVNGKKQRMFQKTPLADNIAWVSYWGNNHEFQARHFLVNNTSVIAVDRHIVVEQEKAAGLSTGILAFSPETFVQVPLLAIEERSEGLTEDDYIKHFHEELRVLRRRHVSVNPIIKLQSLFRGYRVRKNTSKQKSILSTRLECQDLRKPFEAWRKLMRNLKALRQIIQQRGKEYLIQSNQEMKKKLIVIKLRKLACDARQRVQAKKERLKMEYRIGKLFSRNYMAMKHLYEYLQLSTHNKLYVLRTDIKFLSEYILPLAEASSNEQIGICENSGVFLLRSCPESLLNRKTSHVPFLQIVLPASASVLVRAAIQQPKLRRLAQRSSSVISCRRKLSRRVQLPSTSKQTSNPNAAAQLVEISGSMKVIQGLIRSVYQYNIANARGRRLMVYPEKVVKIVSSVVRIQRIWRGYRLRKTSNIKQQLLRQRSAKKIQRWFRYLCYFHRQLYLHEAQHTLKQVTNTKFFIKLADYMALRDAVNRRRLKFLEQNVEVIRNQTSKQLSFQWEASAAIKSISEVIQTNQKNSKSIFSQQFAQDAFGRPLSLTEGDGVAADCYHLIHFNTKCSRVLVENSTYLMVNCSSLSDARLRIFGIGLLTYSFGQRNSIEIKTKINYEGAAMPHTHLLKPKDPQKLFIMLQSRVFPTSRQFYPDDVHTTELTIYLKEGPQSFPFKSAQTVRYMICQPNPPQKKELLPLAVSNAAKQVSLHVQSMHYKQDTRSAGTMRKDSSSTEKKKAPEARKRKSRLEQIGRRMLSFDSQSSSVDILPFNSTEDKVSEPSLMMLSPKSNIFDSQSNNKEKHSKILTEPSLVLSTPHNPPLHDAEVVVASLSYKVKSRNIDKKDRLSFDDGSRFISQFVNVSNFLSKQHIKTQLRNRHYRMRSEIAELAQKNRERQREGLEQTRVQRNQQLQQAKISFMHYREELLKSKQQGRESQLQMQNEQANRRAEQKRRRDKKRQQLQQDNKLRYRNPDMVFAEELYPVDSRKQH